MDKDFNSCIFFSDNERYADIINGIGCDGVPFVRGKDLQELDIRVNFGRIKRQGWRQKVKKTFYRDLVRKTPFGVNFAIIGIENQEWIDYSLALRVLCYDAGEYEKQPPFPCNNLCIVLWRERVGWGEGLTWTA